MGLCSLVGTIGRGVIVGVARFTGGSDQCGITKRSTEQDFFYQLWWTSENAHTAALHTGFKRIEGTLLFVVFFFFSCSCSYGCCSTITNYPLCCVNIGAAYWYAW